MLNQVIEIPINLPAGFTHRPATLDDAQIVTDLLNADAVEKIGEIQHTVEESLQEWSTPGFDLATSSQMVLAADGRLAGYIEVWDNDPLPVRNFTLGAVHPDFLGQGVGTALMNWAIGRTRQALARVPEELQVILMATANEGHQPTVDLFQNVGMSLTRTFLTMKISLEQAIPAPRWPSHLKVVTLREYGNPYPVFKAYKEAFQDHWGHVDTPEEEAYQQFLHERINTHEYDPDLWFIVLDGEEVAAAIWGITEADGLPQRGYVPVLAVRRPWRGLGLGLALLHQIFRTYQARGKTEVTLNVDAESLTGAVRLYEKAGMAVHHQRDVYEIVLRPGRDVRVQSVD